MYDICVGILSMLCIPCGFSVHMKAYLLCLEHCAMILTDNQTIPSCTVFTGR